MNSFLLLSLISLVSTTESGLSTVVVPIAISIASLGTVICLLIIAVVCFHVVRSCRDDFFAWGFYFFQRGCPGCGKKRRRILAEATESIFGDISGLDSTLAHSSVSGTVLEIGPGNGDLFSIIGKNDHITDWIGVEPNPLSATFLSRTISERSPPLPFHCTVASGSDDPLSTIPSSSVDFVIFRHVFCSISHDVPAYPHPDFASSPLSTVLSHCFRVLKPGGQLRLLEHVRVEHSECAHFFCQTLWHKCWRCMCGNCHINRNLESVLRQTIRAVRDKNEGECEWGEVDLDYRILELGCMAIDPTLIGSMTKIRRMQS